MEQNSYWVCPQCNKQNNSDSNKCVDCSCFRSKSKEYQQKHGDWKCSCSEMNFGKRDKCRKCGLFRIRSNPDKQINNCLIDNRKLADSLFFENGHSCYINVNNNTKQIILSSYTDFKDNPELLHCIENSNMVENMSDIISAPSPYAGYKFVIENFMIHIETEGNKDVLLAQKIIEKLGDNVSFDKCRVVCEEKSYFSKRPKTLETFTKECVKKYS